MLSLCLYKSKKFTSTFILIFVSIFLSISNVAYAETMTSENFQLVNNAGQVTAQLTAGGDGTPGLFIYDNNRVPRITIGLYKDQVPTITINDAKGKATGILRMMDNGGNPVLVLKDHEQDKIVIDKDGMRVGTASAGAAKDYVFMFALAIVGGYIGSRLNGLLKKDTNPNIMANPSTIIQSSGQANTIINSEDDTNIKNYNTGLEGGNNIQKVEEKTSTENWDLI